MIETALFGVSAAFAQGVETSELGGTVDVSLVGLFLEAGLIVKLVMIGLLIASVWTWAIIIDKWLLFARTKKQLDRFEKVFWSGQSLEDLYKSLADRSPTGMGALFVSAMREWKRSFERGANSQIGLGMRIDKVLDVSLAKEMTSFQAIAGSKSTSLAVVAPGIAEALLATALGLLAAIPATIFYNKLIADAGKITMRLEGFADEFSAILSRQIDEKASQQPRAAE